MGRFKELFKGERMATETLRQPTAAEALELTGRRVRDLVAKLEAARADEVRLRDDIRQDREVYGTAAAVAFRNGAPMPSRAALTAKEAELPAKEDLIAGLSAAVQVAQAEWKSAKAVVLREQAAEVRAECARRESDINGRLVEIERLQRLNSDDSQWINAHYAEGQRLEDEAYRLAAEVR
jgi:hypothetical protein